MKNLSIPARVAIDNKKSSKCEFRLHDGHLFWHGCPKTFAQPEHDKYCWPKNADLGECPSLDENYIREAVAAYIRTGDENATATIEFGEPKMVNERTGKSKAAKTTAEPAPMTEPATEPAPAPETPAEPVEKKTKKARKGGKTEAPKTTEPAPAPETPAMTEDAAIAEKMAATPDHDLYADPDLYARCEDAWKNDPTVVSADEVQLLMALKRMRGTSVDEATVAAIVERVIARYAKDDPKTLKKAAIKVAAKDANEVYCADFDDICDDIRDGFYVYLYGPAGSGKSHTAEQVARRLGLDFYSQTTVQFAHDVRGYGDAGGNYVPTPFFEAFSKGGLYFQDEFDRSFAEAAIVLNTALANGWYDFPVIGRVVAHPNFRFMGAGNTKMTGADEEYVSGQIIDASTRDRFAPFFEVSYLHEVEVHIAGGDEALVAFVEDARKAIKTTGIKHVLSYRATKYMAVRQKDMAKTLTRCTFKGLEADELRVIYGALENKSNVWAKAMAKTF